MKMLLFWRKRAGARALARVNARHRDQNADDANTCDVRKTLIMLVVLHVYIALCAFVFQHLEYVEAKTSRPHLKGIARNLSGTFNISEEAAMKIIQDISKAATLDNKVYMNSKWNEFSTAIWFVTILFTTVGKSGNMFCKYIFAGRNANYIQISR